MTNKCESSKNKSSSTKSRCFEGKVKKDMPDGRKAGSPCKDSVEVILH